MLYLSPQALSVLMAALQSVKELDPVSLTTGIQLYYVVVLIIITRF